MSLVPYGVTAIAPYAPRLALQAYKRQRLITGTARHIYNYGPTAYRAASVMARAYRNYRGRKARRAKASVRTKIGERVGKSTAKKHVIDNTGGNSCDTRKLYARPLIEITHNPNNDIDDRQRNIINLRGLKLCLYMQNNTGNSTLFVNVAVIWDKKGNQEIGSYANTTVPDFFRQHQGGAARSQDFGVALSALEFHCLPINTDRFGVLMHKRFKLAPTAAQSTGQKSPNLSSFRTIMKYVKIKRQLRFQNTNISIPESGQLYVVHWCDAIGTSFGGGGLANAMTTQEYHVAYFREPKN